MMIMKCPWAGWVRWKGRLGFWSDVGQFTYTLMEFELSLVFSRVLCCVWQSVDCQIWEQDLSCVPAIDVQYRVCISLELLVSHCSYCFM